MKSLPQKPDTSILLGDIRRMIEDARAAVALTVNTGLTALYWRIGKRINDEILKGSVLHTEMKLSLLCRDNWRWNMEPDFPSRTSVI